MLMVPVHRPRPQCHRHRHGSLRCLRDDGPRLQPVRLPRSRRPLRGAPLRHDLGLVLDALRLPRHRRPGGAARQHRSPSVSESTRHVVFISLYGSDVRFGTWVPPLLNAACSLVRRARRRCTAVSCVLQCGLVGHRVWRLGRHYVLHHVVYVKLQYKCRNVVVYPEMCLRLSALKSTGRLRSGLTCSNRCMA